MDCSDGAVLATCSRLVSGLATDLYQLTMGFAHHRAGTADRLASFALFFRRAPFGSALAVAAGIDEALEALSELRFDDDAIAYLASLEGADAKRLFSDDFLERLRRFRFRCDVDAVEEGELVLAHEPLLRVTGPVLDAQLAETLLLNVVGFQTLVATKAARIVAAAAGRPVIEMGFRRAHGPDGALSASRASYLGGCAATSNVLAGKCFGIPVRGTHAHAWVQFFGDEREAFARYADALPGNVVQLVDTYDTLAGLEHAIERAKSDVEGRAPLRGVRLDSGDLGTLSRAVRKRLDAAGLTETKIFASNDLDEHAIAALVRGGAPIDVFGVGTKLVTGGEEPALGAVYKLVAVEEPGRGFVPRIKRSDEPAKASWPGRLAVERFTDEEGRLRCDVLFDVDQDEPWVGPLVDATSGEARVLDPSVASGCGRRLLTPALRGGVRVRPARALAEARAAVRSAWSRLPEPLAALDARRRGVLAPLVVPRASYERRAALLAGLRDDSRPQSNETAR